MAEYDNTNKGTLFRNDKGDNPSRPDYTGGLNVEGKQYRIAAWIREAKSTGNKFLSLNIEESEARKEQPAEEPAEVDESIPF